MGEREKLEFGGLPEMIRPILGRGFLCAAVLCLFFISSPALWAFDTSTSVVSTDFFDTSFVLGSYVDTDKSHYGTGGWSANWFNDINGNGSHDPGEAFSDIAQAGWIQGTDNSCWLASACNLLEQSGAISSAADLYADYALNGVPDGVGGILTWDEGGLQEQAISYWMSQNPAEAANMQMETRFADTITGLNKIFTNGLFIWDGYNPQDAVADYLDDGWQVGIGMWPLLAPYDGEDHHSGGHALTIQSIDSGLFECTDSDRDSDYIFGAGDLNTYHQSLIYDGFSYYGWYNDFYDGSITTYPVGDFGYICAVEYIPEPATIVLICIGGICLRKQK